MKAFRPARRCFSSYTPHLPRSSLPSQHAPVASFCRHPAAYRPNHSFQPLLKPHSIPRRSQSTSTNVPTPSPPTSSSCSKTDDGSQPKSPNPKEPAYQITFRCKPCQTVSTHRMSKQGYHYGAVLIQCPGCKNRHIMADHLGIFTEKGQGGTLDDIMARYGRGEVKDSVIKKGFQDGDLEFWDDGTVFNKKEREREDERNGKIENKPDRKSIDLGNKT